MITHKLNIVFFFIHLNSALRLSHNGRQQSIRLTTGKYSFEAKTPMVEGCHSLPSLVLLGGLHFSLRMTSAPLGCKVAAHSMAPVNCMEYVADYNKAA